MNMDSLRKVFGERIRYSSEIYENIVQEIQSKNAKYIYLDSNQFRRIGIEKGALCFH